VGERLTLPLPVSFDPVTGVDPSSPSCFITGASNQRAGGRNQYMALRSNRAW
jgi:hypothetical protein